MKKKLLVNIIVIVWMLSICGSVFANQQIGIKIDLITRDFTTTPLVMENGTVLVPVKPVASAFRGTVKGTVNTCYVYINHGNKCVVLNPTNIGEYYLQEGEYVKKNDRPIEGKVINENLYVPVRDFVESLDGRVLWDSSKNTVMIYTDSADMNYYLSKQKLEPSVNISTNMHSNNSNSNLPLDKNGNEIQIGDLVSSGAFYGKVQEIKGNRVLVYWDSKSIFVKDEDVDFWSMLAGVRYKSSNWIDSDKLLIER